MALIDIIIPIYNRAYIINRCLDSIYKSTFGDFNIILIDDGSTDDLDSHLIGYNERLQVYHINHGGISKAINKGLESSNSKYIAQHDSDDIMCLNRLEEQCNWMESHPETDILFGMVESPSGYRVKNLDGMEFELTKDNIFKRSCIHPTMFYRRESIINVNLKYDETLPYCVDIAFYIDAINKGLKIYHNTTFCCRVIKMPDGVSTIHKKEQFEITKILKSRIC